LNPAIATTAFVLDNSVLCGWILANQATPYSDAVAGLRPIRIEAAPPQPAALLSLALRFQLTSYDAAYLELALRLQLPIATRDDALAEAAWAAGVGVLTA